MKDFAEIIDLFGQRYLANLCDVSKGAPGQWKNRNNFIPAVYWLPIQVEARRLVDEGHPKAAQFAQVTVHRMAEIAAAKAGSGEAVAS